MRVRLTVGSASIAYLITRLCREHGFPVASWSCGGVLDVEKSIAAFACVPLGYERSRDWGISSEPVVPVVRPRKGWLLGLTERTPMHPLC